MIVDPDERLMENAFVESNVVEEDVGGPTSDEAVEVDGLMLGISVDATP